MTCPADRRRRPSHRARRAPRYDTSGSAQCTRSGRWIGRSRSGQAKWICPTCCTTGPGGGRTSGVVWVDRKVRRRIAAVVRFHPVAALRADAAEAVGRSCPQSAQARTYAAYLLQFLRDRPEAYAVEPAGAWAESGEVWRVRTRCGELRQQGPWLLLPIPGAHPSSRQGRAA